MGRPRKARPLGAEPEPGAVSGGTAGEASASLLPASDAAPAAQGAPAPLAVLTETSITRKGAADTVTVACCNPSGLYLDTPYGKFVVAGTGIGLRRQPDGSQPGGKLPVGGFAFTPGVPKAAWLWWADTYRNTAAVKEGRVYAATSESVAKDAAAERGELRHGYEPADPQAGSTERG